MIQFEELFLEFIILLAPTFLAFVGAYNYMRVKKNGISKLITFGALLILLTWLELFVFEPLIVRTYYPYESISFQYITMTIGAVGYISFFVGMCLMTRKLTKKEKEKTTQENINTIEDSGREKNRA